MKRLLQALLVIVLLTGVSGAFLLHRGYETVRTPYREYEGEEVFFTVERGATAHSVGRELEDRKVIPNAELFRLTLRLRGDTGRIQAGEYRFAEPLSTLEVIDRLVAGDIHTFAVTVPEGLTVAETAEHLAGRGFGETERLLQAFRDTSPIGAIDPVAEDLEGYLFPNTYHFPRDPPAEVVAGAMISQFKRIFDDERRARAEELGMTPREVVTLASIIEKETGKAEERPLIGSVFWNRLERGMSLGSDPTIIYALKRSGNYDGNLRRADLSLDSPYNTYRYPGLPPGPIASPGAESIDAVLHPAETDYLYFVSKNDGSHHFSRSLREHNNAVRKYQVEYFRRRRRQRNGEGPS